MKRILYLNHVSYRSGAENSLLLLLAGLDRNRYEPVVVCPPGGPLLAGLAEMQVMNKTMEMGKRPFSFLHTVQNLRYLIHTHHIDLIHANSVDATQYAALPARLTGVPLIGHVRNICSFRPHGLWLLQQATRLIAVSEATRRALVAQGVQAARVEVIYNGVPLAQFQPTPGARQMMNLPDGVPIVGVIGRLHPIKGHEDFCKAAQILLKQIPDVHFLIAGSDPEPGQPYEQTLRHLVQQLGIQERVHFLGEITQVNLFLAALDVFVLPSHQEPFARVILEAMCSGCAIVATAVGGTPEALQEGYTGLLVPPAQPAPLANAILHLLNHPDLAKKLGQNARAVAMARYDIAHNVAKTTALYDQWLSTP